MNIPLYDENLSVLVLMFLNFLKSLLRSVKASAKLFIVNFLEGSSYVITFVYVVCHWVKCYAVHDCIYIIYPPLLTILLNFGTSAPILSLSQNYLCSWNSLMTPTILIIRPNEDGSE